MNLAQATARAGRPYSTIDPKIALLVDALNETGVIQTIASCQGHARLGKPPYIYFRCPVSVAAAIEKSIRSATLDSKHRLHKFWTLEGRFNNNYELAFCLCVPEYHDKAFSFSAFVLFGLCRRQLDEDILSLVKIVRDVMLDIGNSNVPEIAGAYHHDGPTQ